MNDIQPDTILPNKFYSMKEEGESQDEISKRGRVYNRAIIKNFPSAKIAQGTGDNVNSIVVSFDGVLPPTLPEVSPDRRTEKDVKSLDVPNLTVMPVDRRNQKDLSNIERL